MATTVLKDARDTLIAALKAEEATHGYRVYEMATNALDPPALLISAPSVEYSGYDFQPTKANFVVYVVVKADDRAVETLMSLGVEVADVIDRDVREASVIRMDPGLWPGSADLPAYEISIEMSLR